MNNIDIVSNPNNGRFTIRGGNENVIEYILYNITGDEIQSGNVEKQQIIEIKENRSGIYLLELMTSSERKVFRIIIKK